MMKRLSSILAITCTTVVGAAYLASAQKDPIPRNETLVIDPFEEVADALFFNGDIAYSIGTTTTDVLFGNRSLKVIMKNNVSTEIGWISPDRPHNCHGADSISLWAKTNETSATIRLSFFDDRSCIIANRIAPTSRECNTRTNLDIVVVAEEEILASDGWYQLVVNVTRLSSRLDLQRIRGWMIEIEDSNDEVLFDQLACYGDGKLFGAPFYTGIVDFAEAEQEGTWIETFYQSDVASNQSMNTLKDGRLTMDWVVEQVETWGGFNDIAHLAPGYGYYNLTGATGMVLGYEVKEPASVSKRSIFRFVLQDTSHCESECDSDYHATERWYSFQSIMDDAGIGEIDIRFDGSTEASSPFWFTGWSGIPGNKELDVSQIKGYTLEAVLDSELPPGSLVTGSFSLYDMSAVVLGARPQSEMCVLEEGLHLLEHEKFTRIEFLASTCCDICADDPECLYALANGRDCFIASSVDPESVSLLNTEIEVSTFQSFWMDDATKRGDWCDKCKCEEESRKIDCSGADLAIVPKMFELDWAPKSLDLSDNPRLVILGSASLEEVGAVLEDIRLPIHMKFVAPGSLQGLMNLRTVTFEATDGAGGGLINVISNESGFFGDVCCTPGDSFGTSGLMLLSCELEISRPGIDSIYEPFIDYPDATASKIIRASSTFLAEAAESPEKCAEYCTIDSECRYFLYDARLPNAEHTCMLLENNGTLKDFVCCDEDHFADENQTIPGWMAGRPPRTRYIDDNARVAYSASKLELSIENDYTASYVVSLGSDPLRGAVWVKPQLVTSSGSRVEVIISPPRIALYDSAAKQTVQVKIPQSQIKANPGTLLLRNSIESCDTAFMIEGGGNDGLIYVYVRVPGEIEEVNLGLAIGLPVAFVILLVVFILLWQDTKRKENDMVWMVKKEDLKFAVPPEIIGRGTFGQVLLGEYRGTQVAVKRVLPQRMNKKDSSSSVPLDSAMDSPPGQDLSISQRSSGANSETENSGASLERNHGLTSGGSHVTGLRSGSNNESSSGSRMNLPNSSRSGASRPGPGFGVVGALSTFFHSQTTDPTSSAKTFQRGSVNDTATWKKLRKDFIEEMRYLSKLRHPCVTTVMGAVIGSNVEPLLVMEFMEHGSLYDLLHNETIIVDGELLLPILVDISRGMRFLHSADPPVVHGDLKAANILVDSKFRAKVADFGLSQKKNLGGTGTPFWMAPELLRKQATNSAATDTFSFGVILYEVYSRKDPYEGEDPLEVIRLIKDSKVQKRPQTPPHCPTQIQSLMKDCLAEDPQKRPSFEEIDTRLRRMDEKDVTTGETNVSTKVSLFDIFPRHIAEALRDGRKVEAEHRECVTIFFSDIIDFTSMSSKMSPRKVADLLDRLYSKLDALADSHEIFKVETIGDAYMAVTNLVQDQSNDHARRMALFAIDAIEAANATCIDSDDESKGFVNIRVGFHSGSVVADVVGTRNPRYCLFGDAVNTSHRMESNSKANRIHCSSSSATLLKEQFPELPLRSRGIINIKGKGDMHTYWVNEESRMVRRSTAGRASIITGIERALADVDAIEEEEDESREFSVFSSEGFTSSKTGVEKAPPLPLAQHDIEAPPIRQQ